VLPISSKALDSKEISLLLDGASLDLEVSGIKEYLDRKEAAWEKMNMGRKEAGYREDWYEENDWMR